jgi:hypothetical protein
MRQLMRVLLVNLGVFGILVLILEGIFATLHPVNPLWNSNFSNWGWRWSESAYRQDLMDLGVRGPRFWSEHEANQLGFRGRKIEYSDEDYVVLLVGDSQVEAPAAFFDELPEIILERYLKTMTQKQVRVFSIGAAGWSQDQELLALREYFHLFRANLVLLWHTPINDFWENSFPDRLPASVQYGAGHLKPTFLLLGDRQNDQRIELFHPTLPEHMLLNLLHRSNVGRAVLRLSAALGILDIRNIQPNELALRVWLSMIPAVGGHKPVAQSQCPVEMVSQMRFMTYYDEYAGRALTMEMGEAIEESRSHLTPFLEPLSSRDQYTREITRALTKEIKAEVELKGAEFFVFAPEFRFNGVPFFSEVRCIKNEDKFYQVNPDLLAPMESWKASVNFVKLVIEAGHYGMESITVARRDPVHLNLLGNKLVMEALAERIKASGWLTFPMSEHDIHSFSHN